MLVTLTRGDMLPDIKIKLVIDYCISSRLNRRAGKRVGNTAVECYTTPFTLAQENRPNE